MQKDEKDVHQIRAIWTKYKKKIRIFKYGNTFMYIVKLKMPITCVYKCHYFQ